MNGLLIVNKPKNLTSRDVVNELTRKLGTKKIGHTGTLDPLATGVLVCLIGKYTKLGNLITSYDKEYLAEIKLGIKTDTGDITGNILNTSEIKVTKEQIIKVFNNFPKKYKQEVPLYSAVKINGKKLYEYARNNIEVKLPKRDVNIYYLELISYENNIITFKTNVSKGTYIRSLINDLCNKLNTCGTMNNLIRTRQGNFVITDAKNLQEIDNNTKLLNVKNFFDYPVIELPDNLFKKVSNGSYIPNYWTIKDKVIFTYHNQDIAIYETNNQDLKPLIMLQ